jgi:phosphatidylserine/phosphatidylglycerophosphate/cardiolipin synthase-like enzyme
LDKSNISARYGILQVLKNQDIPFLIDYRPRIAHNKIIVSDKTVVTGSFNFTKAAQYSNAENIIIINDVSLANAYIVNFNARKADSLTLTEYCKLPKAYRQCHRSNESNGEHRFRNGYNYW